MSEEHQRRCWGRVGYFLLRRCRREGNWRLFCDDHKDHWLLLILVAYTGQSLIAEAIDWAGRLRGPSQEELAFQESVYTDISLTCHYWKNAYMSLYPGGWAYFSGKTEYSDVWEMLQKEPKPTYTAETWTRFHPLFEEGINNVRRGLQNATASYSDVLPPQLRTLIWEVQLQLSVEQGAYRDTNPTSPRSPQLATETFYRVRFESVIRQLERLDHEVQRLHDQVRARLEPTD